jgi:Na+/proline symporter
MNRFLILLGLYMVVGTAISIAVFRAKQTEEEYFVGAGMEEAPVLSRAVSQLSH